jgi:sigma-B regulation protein RsbU (phosphoserine phosphatase)
MAMLPATAPEVPGFDIAASCQPARDVGGDLYDFAPLSTGNLGVSVGNVAWGLAVGDVAGKGMAAALYMTLARGLLAAASEDRDDPVEILRDVNRDFYEIAPGSVFVTMLLAAVEPATRRLRFVRAGHTPLIWRRAQRGETVFLQPPGLAVGMASPTVFDARLRAEEIQLEPGDGLFMASDGLSEAMNRLRQEYGDERLRWIVDQTDGLDATQARDKVLADVETFVQKAPVHDDITLVVVRVLEGQQGL